ncbi:MAG: translation initiation factor IF-3 [candidate division WOR-3 bacterium]
MRRPPRTPAKNIGAKYRINEEITSKEVAVVDETGKAIGTMSIREALDLAYSKELDLVEVAPTATPPVCRIMDYGKFIYQEKKKQRESKGHTSEVKEISLRPNISEHDLGVKLRKAREFLDEGHKVRFRLVFKGREIVHSEEYKEILFRIAEALDDVAKVESQPVLNGKIMLMLVRPGKK